LSHQKLEFHELGLLKSRVSGVVDSSKLYRAGNHLVGPDGEFVVFPSDVQTVELLDLYVWSRADATDAGTSVTIDLSYQFRLIPEQVGALFQKRNANFRPLVENVAYQAIKNACVKHSADEYLQQREAVEKTIFEDVAAALLKEANTQMLGVQLRRVDFPSVYVGRKLDTAVQLLKNDAELYKQQAAVQREITVTDAVAINNKASSPRWTPWPRPPSLRCGPGTPPSSRSRGHER